MIDNLSLGISQKLDTLIDECHIYTETVKQGFKTPAFFIQLINSSVSPIAGKRYLKYYSFVINFFPEQDGTEFAQCSKLAELMEFNLKIITTGEGIYRGIKVNSEIVEGVLHFFVQFNFPIVEVTIPDEYMGQLGVVEGLKG